MASGSSGFLDPSPDNFGEDQYHQFSAGERICSAVSVVAAALVLVVVWCSREHRKLVSRLLAWACVGNIASGAATFVGELGRAAGARSALCRFQGFFIETFMVADPCFAFFIALDVYLAIVKHFPNERLIKLEKWWVATAYIPFLVISIAIAIADTVSQGHDPIVGPAVMWCWINPQYHLLRLAVSYIPIWIAIFATVPLQVMTILHISRHENELRRFSRVNHSQSPHPGQALRVPVTPRTPSTPSRPLDRNMTESLAWSYTLTALTMLIFTMAIWLPSSVARGLAWIHPDRVYWKWNMAGALTTSLQGFFNAVVFLIANWKETKMALKLKISPKFVRLFKSVTWERIGSTTTLPATRNHSTDIPLHDLANTTEIHIQDRIRGQHQDLFDFLDSDPADFR